MDKAMIWRREISVAGQYDVIVAGGGVAGVAAALAAARAGSETLLIEREWALGGLATLGLIAIYLPLCDGRGHQVSFGIADELFRLAAECAQGQKPECWLRDTDAETRARGPRMQVEYNPWLFALACEKRLKEAGVTLLYGTQITGAEVKNGRITALYAENKSGCGAYLARNFIDCTGDADLCAFSGEETAAFARGNILASWYYGLGARGYGLNILGEADVTKEDEARGKVVRRLSDRRFSGLDGRENSEMMCMAHEALLKELEKRRAEDPSFSPTCMTVIPELRKTRRLVGAAAARRDGSIACPDAIGVIGDWRTRGPVYALPYAALYGRRVRNLAAAGRCMSAEDEMWEYTRVIPACAVTGEAAGIAAAFQLDYADVPYGALRERLERAGVRLAQGADA